jgi:ATP-dependent Lhr-like helicase
MELSVEVPDVELGPIIRQDIWTAVYDKLVAQIQAHRTSLVFVNTRRLVERVAHQLSERLGDGKVGAHHGSLSRKTRLEVEEKLKSGEFSVVVATASLELGIDIGPCGCRLSYRLAEKSRRSPATNRQIGPLARRHSERHSLSADEG